jgi:hypothetical protein
MKLLILRVGWCILPVLGADVPSKTTRPAIHDGKADGAKQIAEALAFLNQRAGGQK